MSNSSPPANSGSQTIILEEGVPVQETKSYGIGIDCHKNFVQICIITKCDSKFYAHQKEFATDWSSLLSAKDWILSVFSTKSDPVPDLTQPLHYCLESTSTYHQPIVLALGGIPSIINPTIAGSTKRKTDVLDAKLLATHDLLGIWKESYIPSADVNELRVILWERDRCLMEATSAARRINNALLRFGITVGRNGSIVKNTEIRDLVTKILDGETDLPIEVCPLGIPYDVREIIIYEYQKYDEQNRMAQYWR